LGFECFKEKPYHQNIFQTHLATKTLYFIIAKSLENLDIAV